MRNLPAGRPLIYLALVAALGISVLPWGHPPPGAQDSNFFTETGFSVAGRFLDAWRGPYTYQESVALNGYPISAAQPEVDPADGQTYQVQWFERARFELHPEKAPPDDVERSLLGKEAVWDSRRGELPFQPVPRPADAGVSWSPQTQHTIRGAFLQFWNKYGGVTQFGYPLSEAFPEPSRLDGKIYTVQYFERSRFELHPGAAPAYGDVILGQLGVELYHAAPGRTPPGP